VQAFSCFDTLPSQKVWLDGGGNFAKLASPGSDLAKLASSRAKFANRPL